MPIHTYMCLKCDTKEDKIVSFANAENQICDKCEDKLLLVPTFSTAFQLKGRWYKNSGGY